jgi:hypothetical protein
MYAIHQIPQLTYLVNSLSGGGFCNVNVRLVSNEILTAAASELYNNDVTAKIDETEQNVFLTIIVNEDTGPMTYIRHRDAANDMANLYQLLSSHIHLSTCSTPPIYTINSTAVNSTQLKTLEAIATELDVTHVVIWDIYTFSTGSHWDR